MPDPRHEKLADVLVNYSTAVQPGQIVRLSAPPVATPLLECLYAAVLKAGGHPVVRCAPESLSGLFYEHASDAQLDHVSPLRRHEIETIDVSIGLWAEENTKAMSRVDPKRIARSSAASKDLDRVFFERSAAAEKPEDHPGVRPLRWCGAQYPTQASAQDAEMSLREYEDFVFSAGMLDRPDPAGAWRALRDRQQKVVDYLHGKKRLRFKTDAGTDLEVDVEGMTWINCCGDSTFPDGEVFPGPRLDGPDGGVNGKVVYSFPAVYGGREVHDIVLTFEKGRVVDARASKGLDYLIAMLDQDAGGRALGEIAIGTNYAITEYTKNTLFDEKIGGTFHAAVGAGYPETGNANVSTLHWDMVCDLRPGGTIAADGEVFSRDGAFVFDGWPGRD
ncbi:MAG: aminopeptidase [Planctomycetota bacterium]